MAREAGLGWVDADAQLERFAALAYASGAAAERNKLAAWMMAQGYATGHGDSMEDLLKELEWQIQERVNLQEG
jgi:phage tail tape-measure protein